MADALIRHMGSKKSDKMLRDPKSVKSMFRTLAKVKAKKGGE